MLPPTFPPPAPNQIPRHCSPEYLTPRIAPPLCPPEIELPPGPRNPLLPRNIPRRALVIVATRFAPRLYWNDTKWRYARLRSPTPAQFPFRFLGFRRSPNLFARLTASCTLPNELASIIKIASGQASVL